jgi:hypothetical protein
MFYTLLLANSALQVSECSGQRRPGRVATDDNAHTGQQSAVHPDGTCRGWKCVVTTEQYRMYGGHCPMEDKGQVGTRVGFLKPSYYFQDSGQFY